MRDAGRDGSQPNALRLDFDFTMGAGFVILRRELPIDLPEDYRFDLWIKGEAPANNLEFKLVDPTGHNVWWNNARAFEFPAQWTKRSYRARHFEFAWGPVGGGKPSRLGSIEFAIASSSGGKGSVWLDGLTFQPLPRAEAPSGPPSVTCSTNSAGDTAFDLPPSRELKWRADARDATPSVELDLRGSMEFGGLIVDWPANSAAGECVVHLSNDGQAMEEATRVPIVPGRRYLPMPDAQARKIRLEITPAPNASGEVGVDRLELAPLGFSSSSNAIWERIAADAPRGWYPRSLRGEQVYWTISGIPSEAAEALVDEDGAIEVGKLGWRVEPFVLHNGRLLTWADAKAAQSLEGGWMPIPSVNLDYGPIKLQVTCLADGKPGSPTWLARYRVQNTASSRVEAALALAARPFQVLPPSQSLNITGGAARVASIRRVANGLEAMGVTMQGSTTPARIVLSDFDQGEVVEHLAAMATRGDWHAGDSQIQEVRDPGHRACSGASIYPLSLASNETAEFVVEIGTTGPRHDVAREPPASNAFAEAMHRQIHAWQTRQSAVSIHLPPQAKHVEDTIRTTLAYIEINADGDAIQPGSRSYERSWIRDGSLTSAALLTFGEADAAVRFIDWYGKSLFESGKVPCVVDARGPDPVPENDSHGQYIFAVMNAYRYTGDRSILERHWDRVARTVRYIESLRDQRRTEEFRDPNRTRQEPGKPPFPSTALYGLVPESISHEGYSAKPMHSYWDDLFILRGLADAAEMARALGREETATNFAAMRDGFHRDLVASLSQAMKAHGIDYMPGCVELGDFDSTSTTVALWPAEFDEPCVRATFDRYWTFFKARERDQNWDAYTPYELRHVGALVRLGERDRAWEALQWYFQHQRPAGWNQWAEVVAREERKPRFLGDMPHTWCGSDFLNSVRSMLVYERSADESLVVAAGVPASWLDERGVVEAAHLPTWYGPIGYRLSRADERRIIFELSGQAAPPGGIVLSPPVGGPMQRVLVDGQPGGTIDGMSVRVPPQSRHVEIEW